MKRLTYLLAGVFVLSLLLSCEKENLDNNLSNLSDSDYLKKAKKNLSLPTSNAGIPPVIIPGENKGGNRTCEEVATAFGKPDAFFFCSNRVNFVNNAWDGEFPEGLNVNVDDEGIFISFNTDGKCLEIDGEFYKIGAVIVKGRNNANVYFYPDGTLSDAGLAAPGGEAMVSNLTFCLIKCDPLIVAVKSWCWYGDYSWATSDGEYPFITSKWCQYLGYEEFNGTSITFPLMFSYTDIIVANVTVTKGLSGYEVSITAVSGCTLDISHIYIGSLASLLETNLIEGCPSYTVSPWVSYDVDGTTQNFTIPY